MKKRITALLLAAALVAGLLAGCSNKTDPTDQETQEGQPQYAYQTTFSPLDFGKSLNVSYINGLCISGDTLYFAASCVVGQKEDVNPATGEPNLDENGEPYMYDVYEPRLFRMDSETLEITMLEGYKPPQVPEGMQGSASINSITAGTDGTIWINEQMYTYAYNIPEDFDPNTDDVWQYYEEGENTSRYLHLDAEGNTLETRELSEDTGYVNNIYIDDQGYFYSTDWSNVFIYDSEGKELASIPVESGLNNLVKLNDGKVYASYWKTEEDSSYMVLAQVDPETKSFSEEEMRLPNSAYSIYPGNDKYLFLYDVNGTIYGYNETTGEGERLFAWLDCDINGDSVNQFTVRSDGSVLALESQYSEEEMRNIYNLITIKQVDASTVPQKETLTLACMYLDWNLKSEIVEFNRSQDKVRIQVVDYSQYNTDDNYDAGLQKLGTEILSGKVPDILSTSGLPMDQYAGKGIFLDLWPLIDADTELGGRDALMTHLFDAMSMDGKLYQVVSTFSIDTVAGRTEVVGDRTSWTLQELQEARAAMGDNVSIFGEYDVKADILNTCVAHGADGFIDWADKTCNFDSQEFIDMLNFANSFPKEFNWEDYDWETSESEYSRLHSGKQMLTRAYIYSFDDVQYQKALHGGDITFIGYPTTTGNGSSFNIGSGLAISAACKNTEAAWEFVRIYLTEEYQTKSGLWQFTTNKNAFEKYREESMKQEYTTDPETGEQIPVSDHSYGFSDGTEIQVYAMTQEEYDAFMRLYESCNSVTAYNQEINNIISEETAAFFDGQKTAEETASLIQNRISLYINEQG